MFALAFIIWHTVKQDGLNILLLSLMLHLGLDVIFTGVLFGHDWCYKGFMPFIWVYIGGWKVGIMDSPNRKTVQSLSIVKVLLYARVVFGILYDHTEQPGDQQLRHLLRSFFTEMPWILCRFANAVAMVLAWEVNRRDGCRNIRFCPMYRMELVDLPWQHFLYPSPPF